MPRFTIKLIVGLAVVILVGGIVYFYVSQQRAEETRHNPQRAVETETRQLIEQVGQIIALPPADILNGEPTLATIEDKDKLQNKEFFADAENGDKILIYTKAQKAFIYRPSSHQLVNVGPVTVGEVEKKR